MSAELKLSSIRIDGGTQPRAKIDLDIVAEYSERLAAGDSFPPCEVVHDGKEYWLWEGFHRYHAHAKAGKKTISCNVRQGTQRDAVLFSCGANASHGLRRTNEDKRHAILVLLNDSEWGAKSDRWIAEQACVSDKTVASLRPTVAKPPRCGNSAPEESTPEEPRHYDDSESQIEQEREPPKRRGRDGKQYPAKPAAKRATKPKPTGRGEPTVDARKFKAFETNIGKLIRENSALKEHAGGAEFHETIRVALNGCLKTLTNWKKWALEK